MTSLIHGPQHCRGEKNRSSWDFSKNWFLNPSHFRNSFTFVQHGHDLYTHHHPIRTSTSTTLLAVTGSGSKACYTQTAVFVEYRVLADRYRKFSLLKKHGTHGRSFECSRSLVPECKQSSATEGHACSLAQAMKSKGNSQHILKMNEVKVTSNSSVLDLES